MRRLPTSARASDRGETLVELILAIAIIAITAVALIGSVLTSITSSGEHRTLATNDVYLKSFVNSAQQQIQRQANPLYRKCASTYAVTPPADIPATWTVRITSVTYWSAGTWSGTCTGDPAQLITVAATSPTQLTTTISFAVRDPNRLA